MSESWVLDSSVAIRWYLEQPGHEHAREIRDRMVAGDVSLVAPAVLRWELGDVLRRKGVLNGILATEDVVDALAGLTALGVEIVEDDDASTRAALRFALDHRISLFDAAFVVLAIRTGRPLLTADARLARGVSQYLSTAVLRGATPSP
jgi:predicted nucleic acid-binding protein